MEQTRAIGRLDRLAPYAPLIAGTGVGLATLDGASALVDFAAMLTALILLARGHRPGFWVWWLAGSVVIGAWAGVIPYWTIWHAGRILAIGTVATWLAGRWQPRDATLLAYGVLAGVGIQTVSLPLFMFLGYRVQGLSLNEVILGQTGLMLWLMTPKRPAAHKWVTFVAATLSLVASGTRASMLGAAGFTLWDRQWWRIVLLVVPVALFLMLHSSRFNTDRITEGLEIRVDTFQGNFVVDTEEAHRLYPHEWKEPELRLYGYGLGGFNYGAHPPRPHNIVVLGVYEMGIQFAVPILVLGWALWRRLLPFGIVIPFLIFGMFADDPVSSPWGHYVWAAVFLVHVMERRRVAES